MEVQVNQRAVKLRSGQTRGGIGDRGVMGGGWNGSSGFYRGSSSSLGGLPVAAIRGGITLVVWCVGLGAGACVTYDERRGWASNGYKNRAEFTSKLCNRFHQHLPLKAFLYSI